MSVRPVAEGLFTWPSEQPRLLGGRCAHCDLVTFPNLPYCPRCSGDAMQQHEIGATGFLWTWTTQEFLPKNPPYIGREAPTEFESYAIGYIEIPGELRVEARLAHVDRSELTIGMEMTVTTVPFAVDEDGTDVVTFAFQPHR